MTSTSTRPDNTLTIATRKSPLAMWQAEHIKARLQALHPQLNIVLLPMTSRGDHILDVPLAKVGGKGLFVKELEQALLEHKADIAVHSMKDVPMEFPEGLGLSVICEREDPRDAFVSGHFASFEDLPEGAVVGTSSLRRQCQLLAKRPDIQITFLRGNVNTRLRKLDEGEYDGIILAAAGLTRLNMSERITQYLEPELCLPAGGQGALGIETRLGDTQIQQWLQPLSHPTTHQCVTAERAMNRRLEGGCQVPIACYAIEDNSNAQTPLLRLRGLVGEPNGATILADEIVDYPENAEAMGIELAQRLLAKGAQRILQSVYQSNE